MTLLERAKVPLMIIGWPLVVVPVVYVVFSALYGQFTDTVPYIGSLTHVACVVLGGAMLALGGIRSGGALVAAIGTGLLTLTALIAVIIVAVRVGNNPYTGVSFYVDGAVTALTGAVVTVGLALLSAQWSSPRPAISATPGQYGWPQYGGQSGYTPQYSPQPGYSPQQGYQQQYLQPGYPQTGPQPQQQPYPQSGPQPVQPGYPQQPPQSGPQPVQPGYQQQQYTQQPPQQPGQQQPPPEQPGQW